MSDYRLAGTIVAYADRSFGVDSGCTSIIVIDVATRRQLRAIYQVACYSDARVLRFGEITDLVVSPDGSTAWIVGEGADWHVTNFTVHIAGPSGSPLLVDSGPDIVAGSLRLFGSIVTWERAGQHLSAGLP
jgi:hypothetical protein